MPKYYGNTVTEAIAKGLQALGLTEETAEIQVVEEGKKGFLGLGKKDAEVVVESKQVPEKTVAKQSEKPVAEEVVTAERLEVTTPQVETEKATAEADVKKTPSSVEDEEALKALAMYLTSITKEMGAPALVKIKRQDGLVFFQLETEKQGILIGKHGKILNALQYLAQVFVHRLAKNKLSIVVNVGDYRERRKEILERLANKTAERVKRTGQPVFLEPMPAFERKQVHAALTKNPYVKTHSEGDDPYRYLVVEPEKKIY